MAKHILLRSKIICLLLIINLLSCKTYEETIYLDETTYKWAIDDPAKSTFVMVDNNGISQVFTKKANKHYFIESTSNSYGRKEITNEEYIFQEYSSNFGNKFQISLKTGFDDLGDDIYIECARIGFGYDSKYRTLNRVNTYFGNLGQSFDSNGNYTNGLLSKAKILSDFSTSFHNYDLVLKFQLKDMKNKWDANTVVEIYITPKIGLIKYVLNNGIYYELK